MKLSWCRKKKKTRKKKESVLSSFHVVALFGVFGLLFGYVRVCARMEGGGNKSSFIL